MREKPRCRKCGGRHFNFVECDETEEFDRRLAEKQLRRAPVVVRHPEGLRPWHERGMDNRRGGTEYVHLGRSTFAPRGEKVGRTLGTVTPHPDWDDRDAA